MNWNDLEKHFSLQRLGRFTVPRGGDVERAAADYASNVLLSEAMVPMLNVLEIALAQRHPCTTERTAGRLVGSMGWDLPSPGRTRKWQRQGKLIRRHEPQTPDKVLLRRLRLLDLAVQRAVPGRPLERPAPGVLALPEAAASAHNISAALNRDS